MCKFHIAAGYFDYFAGYFGKILPDTKKSIKKINEYMIDFSRACMLWLHFLSETIPRNDSDKKG